MKELNIFLSGLFLCLAIIIMIAGCSFSCSSSKDSIKTKNKEKSDTVFVEVTKTDTVLVDRVNELDSLVRALKQAQDSTKFYRDSVYYRNYINSRRVEKINYYIKICEKNTKNKKYFFGWIKRTMTE